MFVIKVLFLCRRRRRCLCHSKAQYSITATSYPMITTNKNVIVISSKCTARERMFICRRRWWAARWDTQQCKLQSSGTLKYHSNSGTSLSLHHHPPVFESTCEHFHFLRSSERGECCRLWLCGSIKICTFSSISFSLQCVTCKDWVQVIINYSGIGRERGKGRRVECH